MTLSTEGKTTLGVGIVLVVLVINGFASYRATRKLIENEGWVSHTHQVLGELETTLSTLKDAETGERGFIITGAEEYLEPYQAALSRIDGHVQQVKQLTADNPRQQERIPILERKIADRLEGLKTGINLRKNNDAEGARQLISSGSGKRMMDDLRKFIDGMESEENELLRQRMEESRISQRDTFLTFGIASFIACFLLLLVAYVVMRDFRARREAAEALREQQQLLQVTLASIGDAVIATDVNGSVTFLNQVAESLTGWTQHEAQGQPLSTVFDISNELTHKTTENPAIRAMREGMVVGLANHTVLTAKDGRVTPIDDAASPIKTADGKIMGAVLIFRDVTARRRAEEKFRVAVEAAPTAIMLVDHDGLIQLVNGLTEQLLGYTRSELIGQSVEQFVPLRFRGHHSEYRTNFFKYPGRRPMGAGRDLYALRKDGTEVPVEIGLSPIETTEGTFVIAAVSDITERKRVSEAERQARREAEEANRAKDEFLTTLSHELRTPLTAIYGWADLLRNGRLEQDKLSKALEVIDRSVKAQTRLIDDLLNVSRIITGNLRMEMESIDPLPSIQAAIDSVRPAIEAKQIELVTHLDENAGRIRADSARWQQVLWNLLTNAVKFTPRGGRITVDFGRDGSHIQLSVADNGEGIDPSFLPYVFNRFAQADSSKTRKHGGLGLGLAIVRHIVELHGGKVMAHSEGHDKGSTFIVQLPVPALHEQEHEAFWREPDNLSGLRVMLVEDDEDTREIIAAMLQRYGASVTEAASAAEALALFVKQNPPDVLVTDIGMPDMDGYELLAKIRSEYQGLDIPALALTAFAGPEDRQKALRAGFRAYLSKPVSSGELIATVGGLAKSA